MQPKEALDVSERVVISIIAMNLFWPVVEWPFDKLFGFSTLNISVFSLFTLLCILMLCRSRPVLGIVAYVLLPYLFKVSLFSSYLKPINFAKIQSLMEQFTAILSNFRYFTKSSGWIAGWAYLTECLFVWFFTSRGWHLLLLLFLVAALGVTFVKCVGRYVARLLDWIRSFRFESDDNCG